MWIAGGWYRDERELADVQRGCDSERSSVLLERKRSAMVPFLMLFC